MERLTRAESIKAYCLNCSGGSKKSVRECASYDCYLWRYRKGNEIHDEMHINSNNRAKSQNIKKNRAFLSPKSNEKKKKV